MRLTRVDCKPEGGGYRHTVFDCGAINGRKQINIISTVKFDEILSPYWLKIFAEDPKLFLKEINDDENTQSDDNPHDPSGSMV